ncbi:hypothetical protein HBI37_071610 [Parastagonospora nodorum]|nr:hypothetical protein HBH42_091310 [Parastagonospora nodorum]KAH5516469.1 hypothetical protein HBI29_083570 [Parastagonospora nodorum]KAH5649500.1 hypothetical protein HBI51_091020 [Parastagonospora nodorum]KAH5693586.1 hypothetical protein HBI44_150020 [Parastagonospora nodorum]KAH5785943.1 hypothetical protein HBI16_017790 [Parastagonospora nodorum]
MASLLTIPLELLVAISSFLTTPDLGALRLTCKQVEKSLYEWFSKEFFTKKQFMLTYKSLQAFVDISKHSSFSKMLSHVIIATDVYADKPLRFRDKEAAALYTQGFQDQTTLLNTGVDREMLTEAFMNLKNLQTVGIRDFNNHERARDGKNASWSSWGSPTVHRETGIALQFTERFPHSPQNTVEFLARVFQNLIYSLGKANQTPAELEVLLRHHSLPDSAFDVPEFLYPSLGPVLAGLKKLLLRVETSSERTHHTHTIGTASETVSVRLLRRFLGLTSNLEHLRLNLPRHEHEFKEQFLKWLALPASTPTAEPDFFDPPPVSLSCLTKLELGQFQTYPNTILDVVQRLTPTLRRLELWKITLKDVYLARNHDSKPNFWKSFFTKLLKMPNLELDYLKVGMLRQDHMFVQFTDHGTEKGSAGHKVKQYTGKKMEEFLKELTEDVFVLWPQVVYGGDESGENDDDEEMVDDDEGDDGDEDDGDEGDDDDDDE